MQCINYPSIIEDSNINVLKEYKNLGLFFIIQTIPCVDISGNMHLL